MGVDCIGRNESTFFRNSWWQWRPLAQYCWLVAPDLCEGSKHFRHWQTNDGEMNAIEAEGLGLILQSEINGGRTRSYAKEYMLTIDALPDIKCNLCNGTGQRVVTAAMWSMTGETPGLHRICTKCEGEGMIRPDDTLYPFSVENVQRFADFCLASGGFEVR